MTEQVGHSQRAHPGLPLIEEGGVAGGPLLQHKHHGGLSLTSGICSRKERVSRSNNCGQIQGSRFKVCVYVRSCVCVCAHLDSPKLLFSGPQEYGWNSTDTSCMHTHNSMYVYSEDLMGQR